MTDLRTAAQQALEVEADRRRKALAAEMRAALAQQAEPVEPVAWSGYDLDGMVEAFSRVIEAHHSSEHPFHNPIDMDAQMALRILRGFIPAMKAYAALAQQAEPVEPVEPVGWLESPHGAFRAAPLYKMQFPSQLLQWQIALYTAPPQRKPLTEEEVFSIFRTSGSPVAFARAIERAHGIKE